jgi:prepilin-type N-terminal cleavage/methylation domain-containing protein
MQNTSPRKARGGRGRLPRRAGFTLLEVVIVLCLAGLIVGGGIGIMGGRSGERRLVEMSGKLEDLARRARTIAVVQQTSYVVELTEEGFFLHPWVEDGLDEAQVAELDLQAVETGVKRRPVRAAVLLDEDFTVEVMRWGTNRWSPLSRGARQVWRFDPNGLCEPITVKFEFPDGWIQHEYHPLTASVREEEMEAR